MDNKGKNVKKLKSWRFSTTTPRAVQGGTITSIAGGKSAVYARATEASGDRRKSVMRSKDSRVGKSRFAETS